MSYVVEVPKSLIVPNVSSYFRFQYRLVCSSLSKSNTCLRYELVEQPPSASHKHKYLPQTQVQIKTQTQLAASNTNTNTKKTQTQLAVSNTNTNANTNFDLRFKLTEQPLSASYKQKYLPQTQIHLQTQLQLAASNTNPNTNTISCLKHK